MKDSTFIISFILLIIVGGSALIFTAYWFDKSIKESSMEVIGIEHKNEIYSLDCERLFEIVDAPFMDKWFREKAEQLLIEKQCQWRDKK